VQDDADETSSSLSQLHNLQGESVAELEEYCQEQRVMTRLERLGVLLCDL